MLILALPWPDDPEHLRKMQNMNDDFSRKESPWPHSDRDGGDVRRLPQDGDAPGQQAGSQAECGSSPGGAHEERRSGPQMPEGFGHHGRGQADGRCHGQGHGHGRAHCCGCYCDCGNHAHGHDSSQGGSPGPASGNPVFKGQGSAQGQGAPYYILVPGGPEGIDWPKGLLKKPFRKRRPFIFWGGLTIIALIVFQVVSGWLSGARETSAPKLAIINVDGMIVDSTDVVNWIQTVQGDDTYKGAVLRINSPGGGVAASQEIYQAVKRLNASKPVVASMGDVAASGGFYAAMGAREVYANSSTLTASIGVLLELPNIEKLMDTIGISRRTLTTGRLKDAGSSMRPLSREEEAYFMELINDMYEVFLEAVAENRKIPIEKVRQLADGRAMTGRQAMKAGLVDKMGDLHDATRRLAELCHVSLADITLVQGPERPETFFRSLLGVFFDLRSIVEAETRQARFMYY